MKAVFLDRGSFPDNILIKLPDAVAYQAYHNTSPDEVAERIKDADIVLTNKVVLDANAIKAAQKLKYIQVMATGLNNIDLKAAQHANVVVKNVAGYSTESVPEHTFSLLLALRRHLFQYSQDVANGKWADSEFFCFTDYPITDLAGSTLALFGRGQIGQRVAAIAIAFGMNVIFGEHKHATDVREGYVAFDEAIRQADAISLNCPLTEDTQNMIGNAEFAQMKATAILINVGRGGLVDEQALANALETKQIAGAGFDVATIEPMPESHLLQTLAQTYPNFLLTPHVAWASHGAMTRLVGLAMDQIDEFIRAND